MTYWTKNLFTGKVYKGKANSFKDVSLSYGDVLYNPYNKQTVVGWNNYKKNMANSYNKRTSHTPYTEVIEKRDRTIYKYPSGKTFVRHKTMSEIYGNAYDWRSDG